MLFKPLIDTELYIETEQTDTEHYWYSSFGFQHPKFRNYGFLKKKNCEWNI